MAVLIGQPIDARELELATSPWTPERFASMCNDLVWAVSGRQFQKLPSFTERVNAADGGIDAEWEIEVADGDRALPTPIVGPGWNVFQYKKRDLIAQDRRRIISNVKSSLKDTVSALVKERHKNPDRYILFLNVDLKHDQTLALKDAIFEGCGGRPDIHVEVIGAAEIAAFLNSQPHLRAAYFAPLAFKTWEEANRSHRRQKLFGFDVDLVGRDDALSRLKSLVDAPHARVIVVTGPYDIGKSRLVLEATGHRQQDVVFALDPRSMKLDDYRNLVTEQREVICAIEDPDPEEVEPLINEILSIDRLRIIITVPGSEPVPSVSYGQDARVESLHLGPLSEEDARKLLASTQKRLDFGIASWILDRAGGNPGVLLAAANIAEKLRSDSGDFETAVGREFARRIKTELGDEVLKCAELLCPLTHVGVSGRFESELGSICELFGEGRWSPAIVLSELEHLTNAGLATRGGSFAEITIPFLANHLAAKLLRGRRNQLFALFARLDQSGRVRLMRRLSQVASHEVNEFWDALFDPDDTHAPFGTLSSALKQPQMLRFNAGAAPEKTVRLLDAGLLGTTHEERLAISGDARRELMWALEQLLFRAKTSRRALKLIWLLAEAENETWGNNATGVLLECFHPLHSQMPLPLDERLASLRDFTSTAASKEGGLVAIKAAGRALSRSVITLRHSTGTVPLDGRPVFTYGDLHDYARDLVDHLFSIADSADSAIADAALEQLPTLVSELAVQGRPADGIKRLNKLVEWGLSEKPGVSVTSLFGITDFVRRSFLDRMQKQEIDPERREELERHVEVLSGLVGKLETGSFSVRLKRWAGGWHFEDHEKIVVDGQEVYKFDYELQKLAREVLSDSTLLTEPLVSWLVSGHAIQFHRFFFHLGTLDVNAQFRSKIEEIGAESSGSAAFGAYWGGQVKIDRRRAEARLQELAGLGAISGNAVVTALAHLGPSPSTLRLIRDEIFRARATSKAVSGILYGVWITEISPDEFSALLAALVGDRMENAEVAIEVLGRWIHEDRPLEGALGDFAWRCLETAPPVSGTDARHCDRLASKLAQSDPERGYKLLEALLMIAMRVEKTSGAPYIVLTVAGL